MRVIEYMTVYILKHSWFCWTLHMMSLQGSEGIQNIILNTKLYNNGMNDD